ncbi:MAG: excinuclease ABC subunit A [Nitrospinae bacterium CG11_big_fil_rev_8_21_14_0_20_56_8]|nr:MAG: excinuclease ABC subunit A [Nitrospinae bacterium CG11_big_fil_rev_8_21_14_0_20_56_8]
MIQSFRCKDTEKLFNDDDVGRLRNFERVARRKLEMIHAAEKLEDLKQPPGNRLEALKGKRRGQYSIRINDKWRICFKWKTGNAWDVEIVDYH